VFFEVDIESGCVQRSRISVGTCSTWFFNVGTYSKNSGYRWDVFDDVGLISGRVRRGRVCAGRFRRSRLIVGTCSTKSC